MEKNIRNFCIIAHIDHGKSTLADRILEHTGSVEKREMEAQVLDDMELEKERGITIKARAVTLDYVAKDGKTYEFNLIDTPGHVDFNYEVSRSLRACEGALLVVDSTQGIQAQTLANAYLAVDNDLELLPVINKVDLPAADPDKVKAEIEDVIGIPADNAPCVSAKTGLNIEDVLEGIVQYIPQPKTASDRPCKALIFDSFYDAYKGIIVYFRLFEGTLSTGDRIRMMNTGAEFDVTEVGTMKTFGFSPCKTLVSGQVGYLTASIKTLEDTRVGDTITLADNPCDKPFDGFKKALPVVFSGIYPADGARYNDLREALEKLRLNDAALSFEPETSAALGFGFRCGFLGLLHMEVIQERLEREFNLDLITTAPSVIYKLELTSGETVFIDNPTNYPAVENIATAYEPVVRASIITPVEFVGGIMDLCQDRRGEFVDMKYITPT
ncbi:MAG: translation elongation factor 4, partial [Clostridia bacterium]|nr:translation elongation factor 4 [Clostridia bacterium]